MSWELITTSTQASSASTLEANFTNIAFTDVAFFAVVFNGQGGTIGQGSNCRIGLINTPDTSSNYDMESFVISGGASAGVAYHQETNTDRWLVDNSNLGSYSSAIMYIGSDFHNNDKPLCFMKLSSETSSCQMSG